ncbi:MAG: hypothetical protein WAL41_28945, partial [Mycobacterium sp.]
TTHQHYRTKRLGGKGDALPRQNSALTLQSSRQDKEGLSHQLIDIYTPISIIKRITYSTGAFSKCRVPIE